MKKSEIYKFAQISVLNDTVLSNTMKLDIIRELQDKEGTALFIEKQEEKEQENE